jgi:trans-aconitate 2-methyltransferase
MPGCAWYNPVMPNWDAGQYRKFESQRTRAACDLLAQVQLDDVQSVVDLGCGPGNSTILLRQRYPQAKIVGIDNSQEMLDEAKKTYPEISFRLGDIANWQADAPVSLIFANASLHWVEDHGHVFPQLFSQVQSGGQLAIQMPKTFTAPTHICMRELARSQKWQAYFASLHTYPASSVKNAGFYYDLLAGRSQSIDMWQTEYSHIVDSPKDVVEWVKGSGLRPYLEMLPVDKQADFLSEYQSEIEKHYKRQADGKVILPYPRFFLIATAI